MVDEGPKHKHESTESKTFPDENPVDDDDSDNTEMGNEKDSRLPAFLVTIETMRQPFSYGPGVYRHNQYIWKWREWVNRHGLQRYPWFVIGDKYYPPKDGREPKSWSNPMKRLLDFPLPDERKGEKVGKKDIKDIMGMARAFPENMLPAEVMELLNPKNVKTTEDPKQRCGARTSNNRILQPMSGSGTTGRFSTTRIPIVRIHVGSLAASSGHCTE